LGAALHFGPGTRGPDGSAQLGAPRPREPSSAGNHPGIPRLAYGQCCIQPDAARHAAG
jgi:hypothetical protein